MADEISRNEAAEVTRLKDLIEGSAPGEAVPQAAAAQ